jgi:3-deoxy-D-manno-octulosonic-acid transferase
MPHEGRAVNRIVDTVRRSVPNLQSVVVPRYFGSATLPWRRGEFSTKRLAADISGAVVASDFSTMVKHLDGSVGTTTVIYSDVGKVMDLLRLVSVAVIGGTLTRGGLLWLGRGGVNKSKGHNFMEPLSVGVPTIVGPHCQNWHHSVAQFVAEGSLSALKTRDIGSEIRRLLVEPLYFEQRRTAALDSALLSYHRGAASRQADLVCHLATACCGGEKPSTR